LRPTPVQTGLTSDVHPAGTASPQIHGAGKQTIHCPGGIGSGARVALLPRLGQGWEAEPDSRFQRDTPPSLMILTGSAGVTFAWTPFEDGDSLGPKTLCGIDLSCTAGWNVAGQKTETDWQMGRVQDTPEALKVKTTGTEHCSYSGNTRNRFRPRMRYTRKSRSAVNTRSVFNSSASTTRVASAKSIGRSAYFQSSSGTGEEKRR